LSGSGAGCTAGQWTGEPVARTATVSSNNETGIGTKASEDKPGEIYKCLELDICKAVSIRLAV